MYGYLHVDLLTRETKAPSSLPAGEPVYANLLGPGVVLGLLDIHVKCMVRSLTNKCSTKVRHSIPPTLTVRAHTQYDSCNELNSRWRLRSPARQGNKFTSEIPAYVAVTHV